MDAAAPEVVEVAEPAVVVALAVLVAVPVLLDPDADVEMAVGRSERVTPAAAQSLVTAGVISVVRLAHIPPLFGE